jgi:hypothetical protein
MGVDGDAGTVIVDGAAHPAKVKIATVARIDANIFFTINTSFA